VFLKNRTGDFYNVFTLKENMLLDLNSAFGVIHFGWVDLEIRMGVRTGDINVSGHKTSVTDDSTGSQESVASREPRRIS
jgi:hypothetical protein